jgi:cell division protein FtsW
MEESDKNKNVTFLQMQIWRFWRGIDQQLVIACSILILLSILLVTTTSSSVALRIGASEDFFAKRHILYILFSTIIMFIFSTFSIENIKKFGIAFFIINFIFLVLVKFVGYEVKGARRWVNLLGFSLQPSEFAKPLFAIVTAFIFEKFCDRKKAFTASLIVFFATSIMLILQPDIGMLVTLTGIWGVQLFIAGISYVFIFAAILTFAGSLVAAYFFLPHVASRINSFLYPSIHENYQVLQSLKAFKSGGLFGRGPGEGVVKYNIPDSHADFIFSVAGEEFGIIICILISLTFAFIVMRGLITTMRKNNEFLVLASSGIIAQIAIQSIVNMGVSLNLLPTKGMTLPFISYGGSSTIAIGISVGILLSFTKYEKIDAKYNILENERGFFG